MADLPWYKHFPTLFDADTSLLSNRAVGGWQRLLNYMNPKNIETIEGDYGYFSRLLRCQTPETKLIIKELSEQDICDITINANFITLTSRKIKRENTVRENNKIRQQRKRGHAIVTPNVPTPVTHDVTPNVTGERLEVRSKRLEDNKQKIKKKNADAFILPEYINTELWDEYLKVRKRKGGADTPFAYKLVVDELIKLEKAGHAPNEVIKQSIRCKWIDVFPIKDKTTTNGKNRKGLSPAAAAKREKEMDELHEIVDIKYTE